MPDNCAMSGTEKFPVLNLNDFKKKKKPKSNTIWEEIWEADLSTDVSISGICHSSLISEGSSVCAICLSVPHRFAAAGLVRGLQAATGLKLKEHRTI